MSTEEPAHPITTDPNFDDVLRVIDSLLFSAKHKVAR
jgi:alkyl hydroperoxide reductase subunit AhpC